jgi:hypothetical protein
MFKSASVYRRKDRWYFQAVHSLKDGPGAPGGPAILIEGNTPAELGKAILNILKQSRQDVAENDPEIGMQPILDLAGLKSWSTFIRGAQYVSFYVDTEKERLTITPMQSVGGGGFVSYGENQKRISSKSDPAKIGKTLLAALGIKEPKPSPSKPKAKRNESTTNAPSPFGYKCAWLAIKSTDSEAIIKALRLTKPKQCSWSDGVAAAYEDKAFVTPPIKGRTLVAAQEWLMLLGEDPATVADAAIRKLSKQLGQVQLFASDRVTEFHLWAQARAGKLVRGYCWIGERGETAWDEGKPTAIEKEIGPFDWENLPDEQSVMKVAGKWSIDPTKIDEIDGVANSGWICTAPAKGLV